MRRNKKRKPSLLMSSSPLRLILAKSHRKSNKPKAKPREMNPSRGARSLHQAGVGFLFAVCLVVAIVVAAFVFHLHIRFEAIELGYETSVARAQRAQLLVEQRELRLELASLKEPKRIETEALEKLDMQMPDNRKIITIGNPHQPLLASGGAL